MSEKLERELRDAEARLAELDGWVGEIAFAFRRRMDGRFCPACGAVIPPVVIADPLPCPPGLFSNAANEPHK